MRLEIKDDEVRAHVANYANIFSGFLTPAEAYVVARVVAEGLKRVVPVEVLARADEQVMSIVAENDRAAAAQRD